MYIFIYVHICVFGHLRGAVQLAKSATLVDSDLNRASSLNDADWWFQLCENFFCVFFTRVVCFVVVLPVFLGM